MLHAFDGQFDALARIALCRAASRPRMKPLLFRPPGDQPSISAPMLPSAWPCAFDRIDRRHYGAAVFVARICLQQRNVQMFSAVFDAAEDDRSVGDLAGSARDEQIAEAAIKDDFGRDARIDAAEDRRERLLAFHQVPFGAWHCRSGLLQIERDETFVALHQSRCKSLVASVLTGASIIGADCIAGTD